MMHPKTGPTMLPVRGRSDTPAVHKSMSSGESLIEVKCFSVSLVKASAKSLQLSAFFNPQRLLFLCFRLILKSKIPIRNDEEEEETEVTYSLKAL
jgi:hypothetical protein